MYRLITSLSAKLALYLTTMIVCSSCGQDRLEVPLWPAVWAIEPGHSIVVRIATQPAAR
jgi:hypothetical protein